MVLRFFLFAAVFLFASCSEMKFNNPDDPESPNYIGKSSSSSDKVPLSSTRQSSSSSVAVPSSSSSVVAALSSSSSKQSSSSNAPLSSSSVAVPSSSSAVVSSSSVTVSSSSSFALSSSSVAVSSSSSKPSSSSSATPSSSSVVSSSNSTAVTSKGNDIANYRTIKIGEQVWMAENLDYNVSGSKCYDNKESNCAIYGRLYTWATANTVCPSGWHLPSNADWNVLMKFVNPICPDNSNCEGAGKKLKATSGWADPNGKSGNGEDTYGFSALPGGAGNSDGSFSNVGNYGYWWSASASEDGSNRAYYRLMDYDYEGVGYLGYGKDYLYSVRCLQD